MVYALALAAALVVAAGEVVQQRLAAQAPPQDSLSPRLLLWLVRRPRWLAGVAGTFAGDSVFSAAVAAGSVVLVEAVFTVRLVFGLAFAALWGRRRIPARDLLGALAITAGLVAFLLVARPQAGTARPPDLRWALGGGAAAVLAAVLAAIGSRLRRSRRALLLGLGAGVLFGLQASLMKRSVAILTHQGVPALLTTWSGYAVVVVALGGMLLIQSAFSAAPLAASYPGVVIGQLGCSMAIGVVVLGGRVQLGSISLATGGAALALLVTGVLVLTRSPLVTGAAHHHPRAPVDRPGPAGAPARQHEAESAWDT